jgi:hypothetical protein
MGWWDLRARMKPVVLDYLPSLLNQPIEFFSCFISYSSKDQKFADRLHADLQNKGVRCWFAPHDLPIGAKIIDSRVQAPRVPFGLVSGATHEGLRTHF